MAVLTPPFGSRDVEIIGRDTLYRGFSTVHTYRVRHRLHEGGWSGEVCREVLDAGDAVVVLPYDPQRDEVVLVEQFRAPPLLKGRQPWVIECVAGKIDRDATPEEIAHAEAYEEAGLSLSTLERIGSMYASPGLFSEYVHCYCGRTKTAHVSGVHGLDEEHEDIKVHVVPFEEAMAALGDGRIETATVFATLQWLALNRERLRRQWT